jgi:hypothetical protein
MKAHFVYQALATYDVTPRDVNNGGAGKLRAGLLYLYRHGNLQSTPLGEIRGSTLYLMDTAIVIGNLDGDLLTLSRTLAQFTLEIDPAL